MSVMVLSVLFSLVCVLCVVQVGSDDVCFSYVDTDGVFHDTQECHKYCCGHCNKRSCCSDKKSQLKQELCPDSAPSLTKGQIALIVGSIIGTIVPVVLFVALVICCVSPCCFCYKKCRQRPNQRQIILINSNNPVNPPQQPSCPGYQSVPAGPPMPTAPPPPYQESTSPTHFPVPSGHPLQPPNQPYAPPPYSVNPSDNPNP